MKNLNKIFDFYVFSNLHVAIASYCFTKLTLLFYGDSSNLIPLFVMFSTFLAYNFLRIYDIKNNLDRWLQNWFWNNLTWIIVFSFIAFLALIILFLLIKSLVLLWFIPMIFLTLLYIIPVINYKNQQLSFRNFPYIKILYVVFVWSFSTVFIPYLTQTFHEFDKIFILFFISRFLFFLALIIPFEIRDIGYDSANLKTLPQVIGINKSKLFGVLLLLICGILNVLIYTNSKELIVASIILMTSCFLILNSKNKQSKYYSAFWVEGIPIIWLIIVELQF